MENERSRLTVRISQLIGELSIKNDGEKGTWKEIDVRVIREGTLMLIVNLRKQSRRINITCKDAGSER